MSSGFVSATPKSLIFKKLAVSQLSMSSKSQKITNAYHPFPKSQMKKMLFQTVLQLDNGVHGGSHGTWYRVFFII